MVQYVEANVRDSLDMLSRLPQKLEGGNQLSTFDVNNLYGNISHSLGLTMKERFFYEIFGMKSYERFFH